MMVVKSAMMAGLTILLAGQAHAQSSAVTVEQKLSAGIPNIPGKSLRTIIVTYAPGASSSPHRHAKSAYIYAQVIEGEIRSQVDDEPARIYKPGDYWTENPGAHHRVSENASKTAPARMLVAFIVDSEETTLTTPDAR